LFLLTERHFPIGKRTLSFEAARLPMVVAVEPAQAVVGTEIVYH
jgi:hypothetical protein